MPTRRRPLLALLVAGCLLMFLGWCGAIGYRSSTNAKIEAYELRTEANRVHELIYQARQENRIDKVKFRAAAVIIHEITPLRVPLRDRGYEKQDHRWSIRAAYRYHVVRSRFIQLLDQLDNLLRSAPATRSAT